MNKFSTKNIFEKKTVVVEDAPSVILNAEYDADGDIEEERGELETLEISKLETPDILDYVNSFLSPFFG